MSRRIKALYESHVVAPLLEKVWSREGDKLVANPVEQDTPLRLAILGEMTSNRIEMEDLPSDLADLAKMEREELAALVVQLIEDRDEVREHTQSTLLNYLFAEGPHPLKVAERIFMFARGLSPSHVWMMKSCEAADLFCQIKQTWQQMEQRCLEELAARMATTKVFTMPGGKSQTARERYSADKQGNTSRRLGRKCGDLVPPDEAPEEPRQPRKESRLAREKREMAEREALAREIGCDPSEIDLTKISPDWD